MPPVEQAYRESLEWALRSGGWRLPYHGERPLPRAIQRGLQGHGHPGQPSQAGMAEAEVRYRGQTDSEGDAMNCTKCGHPRSEHGQERDFYQCDDSRREVCLRCPGYELPGYPNGAAWHSFRVAELQGGAHDAKRVHRHGAAA